MYHRLLSARRTKPSHQPIQLTVTDNPFRSASSQIDDVDSICDTYEGNDNGDEPEKLTSNESNEYCQF